MNIIRFVQLISRWVILYMRKLSVNYKNGKPKNVHNNTNSSSQDSSSLVSSAASRIERSDGLLSLDDFTGDDKVEGEGDGGSANGISSGVFYGVEIRQGGSS